MGEEKMTCVWKGEWVTAAEFKARTEAAAKPFVVYYRTSRGKGFKRFATEQARVNFINRAPMSYAITGWN